MCIKSCTVKYLYLAFLRAIVDVIGTEFALSTTLLILLLTVCASPNHRFLDLLSLVEGSNCLMSTLKFSFSLFPSFESNSSTLSTVENKINVLGSKSIDLSAVVVPVS